MIIGHVDTTSVSMKERQLTIIASIHYQRHLPGTPLQYYPHTRVGPCQLYCVHQEGMKGDNFILYQ